MRIFILNTKPLGFLIIFFVVSNIYSLKSNPIYITQSDSYHIVSRGETLYGIGRKYSISVDMLKLYNNLDSDDIIVGQKIYLNPSTQIKREYVTQRDIPSEGYHLVKRGETVYRISRMYDIEIMDILAFNNLQSFDIQTGQKIWLIPGKVEPMMSAEIDKDMTTEETPDEIEYKYHIVSRGENLYRISLKYGMSISQLKDINSLTEEEIHVGQRLKVIADRKVGGTKVVTPTRRPITDNASLQPGTIYLPVNGRVVSEFGIRNNMPHNGIDIAAPMGTPIHAALDGQVVFVGVQRGYGNVVVLEHKDFIMTVYAHNERNLVRLGDEVKKGQPIATVGQSGNASGPHLHFEYRLKGKAINPRKVLPVF